MNKALSDRELEQMYDEMLAEIYGDIEICGYKYDAARAFKEVDPVAYRCGFVDWLDSECSNESLFERDGEYYAEDPSESEAV